ncbi:MAG: C39 family peptidase, partial [Chloroflexota bacterium]|nr:C39 family peptidase [Chloroflexota bacterium]
PANDRPASPQAAWVRTVQETTLWSGPDEQAKDFSKIAADTTLQVLEMGERRMFVYFAGDKQGHPAGEVWVNRADVATASWPQWLRARHNAEIRPEPTPAGPGTAAIARGTYIETTGETDGRWARVFYLGDGRLGAPIEGWIDGADFVLPGVDQTTLTSYLVSKGLLASRAPDVWMQVPYRSQLDGTEYALANCGPVSVGMALEAFGQVYGSGMLRSAALTLQDTLDCDYCGVFIQNLATVAQSRGVQVVGLRKDGAPAQPITEAGRDDNENLRRWTLDDIRTELRAGRVVIPQIKYRFLPGRASSPYGGDHFVVITGMVGDRFIMNDPIDSDGRGYARLISADALERGMALASVPKVAFAAGK